MIRVLKFGSSVLRSESDLPVAVAAVERERAGGHPVVAVVSAFGRTTDELLARAEQLGLPPRNEATAALLASGETVASALLALALHHAGIPALLLDPAQAGLRTAGAPLAAEPRAVDAERIRAALARAVVVLPGFAGRDAAGATTLLGRGGSDLTAVFLAHALGGDCVLFKDTDGIYTADPSRHPAARRFASASYSTVIAVAGAAVQRRAVRFAADHGIVVLLTTPSGPEGTWIGPGPDRLAPAAADRQAWEGAA
jgi:homoserine dehydrogenase